MQIIAKNKLLDCIYNLICIKKFMLKAMSFIYIFHVYPFDAFSSCEVSFQYRKAFYNMTQGKLSSHFAGVATAIEKVSKVRSAL